MWIGILESYEKKNSSRFNFQTFQFIPLSSSIQPPTNNSNAPATITDDSLTSLTQTSFNYSKSEIPSCISSIPQSTLPLISCSSKFHCRQRRYRNSLCTGESWLRHGIDFIDLRCRYYGLFTSSYGEEIFPTLKKNFLTSKMMMALTWTILKIIFNTLR